MRVTVRVTQEHIDRGIARHCDRCPVALAMVDAGFDDPRTYQWGATYQPRGEPASSAARRSVKFPPSVARFIGGFDGFASRTPVRPFDFVVEVKP